jgi:hypothetical protein
MEPNNTFIAFELNAKSTSIEESDRDAALGVGVNKLDLQLRKS